jgi:WD40 repeat protein
VPPATDAWVAAVHRSPDPTDRPVGTAVVIDARRLLTSAHVATGPLWLAFPKSDVAFGPRLPVVGVRTSSHAVADLAVLEVDALPPGVSPAPLRCPRPDDLVDKRWWAFGFAGGDPLGNAADGTVGAALAYGWVRLDAASRYHVEPGFSGGGLWSPDYGAVVAVVGAANARGDGQAITLHQADLPDEGLRALASWTAADAGEIALASWGWSLSTDAEAVRHWRPRARGVSVESEAGYRFRGRRAALTEITAWLDRSTVDSRVLVVTGSPGVGKSAVLGRIVTTADPDALAALPDSDDGARATVGSVACAVHAKGKTAYEVAGEIARAASAALPDRLDDLLPSLHSALSERDARFNIVIDALDEALNPTEAGQIITRVVLPIAETCASVGAAVTVGTRRNLLRTFGPAATVVDLDLPGYFAVEDLAAYALATLRLRPDNPYQHGAEPVAQRIAELSDQNFLVAGLIARSHGLYDTAAVAPGDLSITPNVETALDAYLDRMSGPLPARDVLAALSYAEATGIPVTLWQTAIDALGGHHVDASSLRRFAHGSAANFLVESFDAGQEPTYRLFHQALSDTLYDPRGEAAITRAFLAAGRATTWADPYLRTALSGHATRAGLIDELLDEDTYLLHADLRRLIPAAAAARTHTGRARARLLRLTPRAIPAGPRDRAALFDVTESLEALGTTFRRHPAPYHVRWADTDHRSEVAVLEGHTDEVRAMCTVAVGPDTLLATGSRDGTICLWDPATAELRRRIVDPTGGVRTISAIRVGDRTLLATGSRDGSVQLWDPETGVRHRLFAARTQIWATCTVPAAGRDLLAISGRDGSVLLWDPDAGEVVRRLAVAPEPVLGVVAVDGAPRLVTGSGDGSVVLWDPVTGDPTGRLARHAGAVLAVCALDAGDRLAVSSEGDLRLWDLVRNTSRTPFTTVGATALSPYRLGGRTLLATAGPYPSLTLRDPDTGVDHATFSGHADEINVICAVPVGDRTLLATASTDDTVRLWDPLTSRPPASHPPRRVTSACALPLGDRVLIGTGGHRRWELRDPVTGEVLRTSPVLDGWTRAVCPVPVEGRTLLATGNDDRTVRLWDPATGTSVRVLDGHIEPVMTLCTVRLGGSAGLASAGSDQMILLWDPATDERARIDVGAAWIDGLATVPDGEHDLLAVASDGPLRLWDPVGRRPHATLDGPQLWTTAVAAVDLGGAWVLLSGAQEQIQVWDPYRRVPLRSIGPHPGEINAICAVETDDRVLIATGGQDRTVRLWDAATGQLGLVVPMHHRVAALVPLPGGALFVGTAAGPVMLDLATGASAPL